MPTTNIDLLLPNMRQGPTATLRVEAEPRRNSASLFGELVDTVNPLQHIPGVSQGYRAITKDQISEPAKFAGHVGLGAAIGGPVGAAIGAGVYLIEGIFGALFGGSKKGGEELVQAETVQSAPTALNGNQAIHAGVMRPGMLAAAQAPAAHAAKPATPADLPAQPAANRPMGPLGSAPVQMSSNQFAALMAAFGSGAPTATPAAPRNADNRQPQTHHQPSAAITGADFAARMAANLDKLDALKQSQGQ